MSTRECVIYFGRAPRLPPPPLPPPPARLRRSASVRARTLYLWKTETSPASLSLSLHDLDAGRRRLDKERREKAASKVPAAVRLPAPSDS